MRFRRRHLVGMEVMAGLKIRKVEEGKDLRKVVNLEKYTLWNVC
jgi:hypothetical protein